MALSYSQQINPIRSQIWCPFKEQHTELGVKVTNSYGAQSHIRYMQLGDGSTSSTFPSMIGSKGFRFNGSQYLGFTGSSLTLGNAWSICMMIRPKVFPGGADDKHLVGFSNGGGIILNDSGESNELTYYDGTTTVSSGIELSNDRFYSIIITKDSSNNITIYVDGEEEGTGVGTNSGFDLDYIGCDESLGGFYYGELREFCVFDFEVASVQSSILNNRFVNVIEEQQFYWTPADAFGASSGIWLPYRTGLLTYNTQPVITNPTFDSATGWSLQAGWSISGGKANASSASVTSCYQVIVAAVIGNRYVVTVDTTRSAGTFNTRMGSSSVNALSSSGGEYTAEGTWLGDSIFYLEGRSSFTGTADNPDLTNLSLTQWEPESAVGTLAGSAIVQATDADMPWDNGSAVQFDTADDAIILNAALADQKFVHSQCTLAMHCKIGTLSNYSGLAGSSSGANPSTVGIAFYTGSSGQVLCAVANGSGTLVYDLTTPAGTIVAGTWHTVIMRLNATNLRVRVDGSEWSDSSPVGSLSTANANFLLRIGNLNSGFGLDGEISDVLLTNRVLTNDECEQLEAYWS